MNKKHVCIFATFLVYNLAIFSESPVVATPPVAPPAVQQDVMPAVEIVPTFTEQLRPMLELALKNLLLSRDYIRSSYNQYVLGQEPPKQPKKSIEVKKQSNNDPYLTKNQQYAVAATVLCVIAAGIIYKYDLLASQKEESITVEEVQELVEIVVHNSSIPKQDQLNKIFEILIRNGLDNIVVYNDHMFEVNDQFKVEIKGKAVKVTRS